jgi:threonine efflux protein
LRRIMDAQLTLFSLCLIHLLAVMSPGPDFIIVTRLSISGGVSRGILAAAGIASANAIHLLLAVFGATLLMEKNPWLMSGIKVAGALYLAYIGIRCLLSKPATLDSAAATPLRGSKQVAFQNGFFTSLFNSKAMIYFLSIASQFNVSPEAMAGNAITVVILLSIAFGWFSFISAIAGHPVLRTRLMSRQYILDRAMGTALIAYSGFILVSIV